MIQELAEITVRIAALPAGEQDVISKRVFMNSHQRNLQHPVWDI